MKGIREVVAPTREDRPMDRDIERMVQSIVDGDLFRNGS